MKKEFLVTSSAFPEGGVLPAWYTIEKGNSSPPFGWDGAPPETVTLAVICRSNQNRVHWVLWNIPVDMKTVYGRLPSHKVLPGGLRQGVNDCGYIGWIGPRDDKSDFHLTIHLYALDFALPEEATDLTADDLLALLDGHVLKETSLSCVCS